VTADRPTIDGWAAPRHVDQQAQARLERLDERLDDQYDRVRFDDGTDRSASASTEEAGAKGRRDANSDSSRASRPWRTRFTRPRPCSARPPASTSQTRHNVIGVATPRWCPGD